MQNESVVSAPIVSWSEFPNVHAKNIEFYSDNIDNFGAHLAKAKAPSKEKCPLISLVDFGENKSKSGSYRHDANAIAVDGVIGDYDDGLVHLEDALEMLEANDIIAVLYPTPSHSLNKPRWRVVAPTSKTYPTTEHKRLTECLNRVLGGVLAKESYTLSQSYYFGDVGTNEYKVIKTKGTKYIDQLELVDEQVPKKVKKTELETSSVSSELFLAPTLIADLKSALETIPSDDRVIWIQIGHALKTIGEAGKELWMEWSFKSSKFDPLDAQRCWESFNPQQTSYQVVFAEAQRQGWINPLTSEALTEPQTKKLAPTKIGDLVVGLFNSLKLNDEDVKNMAEAEFLIPNLIVRGHLMAFVSPANGGKTAIFVKQCEKLAAQGLKVIYINVDGSPSDLKRHHEHASEYGYAVIAPDAKAGKSTDDVIAILESIASGEASCEDVVIIIDTLKKFLDVINKLQSKKFYKMLRAITVKGATICLLGHTNKYVGEDGKPIFEGTADLRNDLDELIYLDSCKNDNANTLEVTTRPDKVRAEFSPKSFLIQLPDRTVIELATAINILAKEDRAMLDLINGAIANGSHTQKEIISYVESLTAHSPKKIRQTLIKLSQNTPPDVIVTKSSEKNALIYSTAPNLESAFSCLNTVKKP